MLLILICFLFFLSCSFAKSGFEMLGLIDLSSAQSDQSKNKAWVAIDLERVF